MLNIGVYFLCFLFIFMIFVFRFLLNERVTGRLRVAIALFERVLCDSKSV